MMDETGKDRRQKKCLTQGCKGFPYREIDREKRTDYILCTDCDSKVEARRTSDILIDTMKDIKEVWA